MRALKRLDSSSSATPLETGGPVSERSTCPYSSDEPPSCTAKTLFEYTSWLSRTAMRETPKETRFFEYPVQPANTRTCINWRVMPSTLRGAHSLIYESDPGDLAPSGAYASSSCDPLEVYHQMTHLKRITSALVSMRLHLHYHEELYRHASKSFLLIALAEP